MNIGDKVRVNDFSGNIVPSANGKLLSPGCPNVHQNDPWEIVAFGNFPSDQQIIKHEPNDVMLYNSLRAIYMFIHKRYLSLVKCPYCGK